MEKKQQTKRLKGNSLVPEKAEQEAKAHTQELLSCGHECQALQKTGKSLSQETQTSACSTANRTPYSLFFKRRNSSIDFSFSQGPTTRTKFLEDLQLSSEHNSGRPC